MNLFYVTEAVRMAHVPDPERRVVTCYFATCDERDAADAIADEALVLTLVPPRDGRIQADVVYFAPQKQAFDALAAVGVRAGRPGMAKMVKKVSQQKLLEAVGAPPRVGFVYGRDVERRHILDQVARLGVGDAIRIAILNPFGGAFGDTLVSLTAFRELRRELMQQYSRVRLDVLQAPGNAEAERVYLASGVVNSVMHLPAPLSTLGQYHAFIDLASDPLPGRQPVVDEIMDALGLCSALVPTERKRNALPQPNRACAELASAVPLVGQRAIAFVHTRASTRLRTIPEDVVKQIVKSLLDETSWDIWSAVPLPVSHERIHDWSAWCTSFERLCALVARSDIVLSTDTSVYHVADAFNVPGVALFVAKLPLHWAAYYPEIDTVALGGDANPLRQLDRSESAEHVAHAEMLWRALSSTDLIERMRRLIDDAPDRRFAMATAECGDL